MLLARIGARYHLLQSFALSLQIQYQAPHSCPSPFIDDLGMPIDWRKDGSVVAHDVLAVRMTELVAIVHTHPRSIGARVRDLNFRVSNVELLTRLAKDFRGLAWLGKADDEGQETAVFNILALDESERGEFQMSF
jgi:hypothetical protein